MLHPSYTELIKVINSDTNEGDTPVVNSRYSIVLATAKRARQIIDGKSPMSMPKINKPLSIAVDELNKGLLKIQNEEIPEEEPEVTGAVMSVTADISEEEEEAVEAE